MTSATLTLASELGTSPLGDALARGSRLGLVLLWSRDEPDRVGEVCLLADSTLDRRMVIGRDREGAASWWRLQPGRSVETGPLASAHISRQQLAVTVRGPRLLEVENLGRGALIHAGQRVDQVRVSPGDLLEVHGRLLLMCVERRPLDEGDPLDEPLPLHPFGEADAAGIVGESPAAWQLRRQLRFIARRDAHVLVRGASGTGKELAAQAIHAGSARAARALVARNAATFPETLVDAELFGNAKGYPQAGMPERPGLVGEADRSSLFLDEFAELPQAMQAHLLRVLDAGEYARLGESKARRSDFRLIAATNRPEHMIKEDVLARFRLRVELPGLEARREDVPMLVHHLLRGLARKDADIAARYFPDGDPRGCPRVGRALVQRLVTHRYATHVRELEAMLWKAMTHCRGDVLEPWPAAAEGEEAAGPEPSEAEPAASSAKPAVDPESLTAEQIQACLDRHGGRQEPAWRELGLASRHVLTRLVKRHQLRVKGRTG